MARIIPDWLAFWDNPHFIYVNARHKDVHYRLIAREIAALVPAGDARVLDYGSGEALHADIVAEAAGELVLCEAAPSVLEGLEKRFAANPKIRVVAPHVIAKLPAQSFDLIVMHSVVQYMTVLGADVLLSLFHRLLKPGGVLIVGDVVQPHTAAATDAFALLRFGQANGFFFAAVWGIIRTVLSDYWRLRSHLGLTRYDNKAMLAKLAAAGFTAERAPVNIGHNQERRTYYARPR
jgi:SAM-dependent methyltransferase